MLGPERDRFHLEFNDKLKELILEIQNKKKFENALINEDLDAIEINKNETIEKKISLNISMSQAGTILKDYFMSEVEDEVSFKKWPFKVEQFREADNLSEAIFSIHVFTSETELIDSRERRVFDLALEEDLKKKRRSMILWVSRTELMDKLPQEMKGFSTVIGTKPVEVIERINLLEKDRQEQLKKEKERFSQLVNVFLLYDFSKDHSNQTRIRLKQELENQPEIIVHPTPPDPAVGEIEENLKNSKGVILFYGDADSNWYCSWQSKIQKFNSLRKRAVCIAEPEVSNKLSRDVSKGLFMVMEKEEEIPAQVSQFINDIKFSA